MELKNRVVLVLGLGDTGLSMARWCAREQASFRVADSRELPPCRGLFEAQFPDVSVHLGGFPVTLLEGVDLVLISPGLALRHGPQRELLDAARNRSIPILGDVDVFAQKLARLRASDGYAPDVVAITGTNGKTTVTSLTGRLCARAGLSVSVAGNIGPPLLDALAAALDGDSLPAVWVLELSSFQLETTRTLVPTVGAILNITQDHLDWHGSTAAYTQAKSRVLTSDTVAILNRDDPSVMALRAHPSRSVATFGMDPPCHADSFGVVGAGDVRWLAYAQAEEIDLTLKRPKRTQDVPFVVKRLMPVEALQIRGDHNAANALAALAICHAIGLPMAPLLHGLRAYRGEPHRVELVATIDGVDYFDDSKGTNVGATVAALTGLGKPVVLIAGGDGKDQDFTALGVAIVRHARAVLLIGRDAGAIRAAIETASAGPGVELVDCTSLEAAVARAQAISQAGDAVLLSPACASLDMFRDYRHRAEVFVKAVHGLQRQGREVPAPC